MSTFSCSFVVIWFCISLLGYVSGNLLVWGAVNGMGVMKLVSTSSLTSAQLQQHLAAGHAVVAAVNYGKQKIQFEWVFVPVASFHDATFWNCYNSCISRAY